MFPFMLSLNLPPPDLLNPLIRPTLSKNKRLPKKRRHSLPCLMISLLQIICMPVFCHSDARANFINLESTTLRASVEASAFVVERGKLEAEKGNMRHDRELWEKVPEDGVPMGASWFSTRAANACQAYGKREVMGASQGIPEGWSVMDAFNQRVPVASVAQPADRT